MYKRLLIIVFSLAAIIYADDNYYKWLDDPGFRGAALTPPCICDEDMSNNTLQKEYAKIRNVYNRVNDLDKESLLLFCRQFLMIYNIRVNDTDFQARMKK